MNRKESQKIQVWKKWSLAFPYMYYSQSYKASNTKGWDLEKWVRASLNYTLGHIDHKYHMYSL